MLMKVQQASTLRKNQSKQPLATAYEGNGQSRALRGCSFSLDPLSGRRGI